MGEGPVLFGDRLRLAREHRQLSQLELARRAQVDQGWISRLESGGRHGVSLQIARDLAIALQVSLDYLTGRTTRMAVSEDTPGEHGLVERDGVSATASLLAGHSC